MTTPDATLEGTDLLAGADRHLARSWKDTLKRVLTDPWLVRPLFAILRTVAPICRLPGGSSGQGRDRSTGVVVVTRAADVREVIGRPEDFTISEINGARIERAAGSFILGLDRGETFDRELAALQAAAGPADAATIDGLVRELAACQLSARLRAGSIDIVNGYARPVALGITARYLGVAGPDAPTMARWCRALFEYTFLSDDPRATALTDRYAPEMAAHLTRHIAERRAELDGGAEPTTVLDRLITQQSPDRPWLDDEAVRRNISGLVVGAIDTTSKAVTFAMIELLARPEQLADAADAARAGDLDRLRHHVHESLRFRPHQPVLARHCRADTTIGRHRLKAGQTVIAATFSARFDRDEVPDPRQYQPDRDIGDDLTFGSGMHECFGRFVNEISLPLLVGGLVALPDVSARGRVRYDGPFPDRFALSFRAGQPLPGLLATS